MYTSSIDINGIRISYNTCGSGAPVLLIHGNTGSKVWFEPVMQPEMEIPGVHTIAPDIPNFGDSDRLDRADIDLYADYIRDFIKKLEGVVPPVAVVGHSLGGAVAIALALRNPELVSKLMLVDSAPLDGLKTPEKHYPVIEQYKQNRELLSQALKAVMPTMDDEEFLQRLSAEGMKMNPIAFTGNARALAHFDYTGRGKEFEKPVFVVAGEQDVLINRDMAQATADAFPNARMKMLAGVGHSVMVEAPQTFRDLVREFLS
jgi:branched-chain amino acid transport system permease protein